MLSDEHFAMLVIECILHIYVFRMLIIRFFFPSLIVMFFLSQGMKFMGRSIHTLKFLVYKFCLGTRLITTAIYNTIAR